MKVQNEAVLYQYNTVTQFIMESCIQCVLEMNKII